VIVIITTGTLQAFKFNNQIQILLYTLTDGLPSFFFLPAVGGEYLSDSTAGVISTLFDLGGVIGGILAGHISDCLDARALTAASFTFSGIPALFLYRVYGSISLYWNVTLMFITGMLVNGPYALITTAVSADLGTHSSLRGNSRALATVTAIIDGTGSAGAAIGPLLTGYISAKSLHNADGCCAHCRPAVVKASHG
jgi:OPA family glycerol-3-phosphate transporter-like MFS transporter 1/2